MKKDDTDLIKILQKRLMDILDGHRGKKKVFCIMCAIDFLVPIDDNTENHFCNICKEEREKI